MRARHNEKHSPKPPVKIYEITTVNVPTNRKTRLADLCIVLRSLDQFPGLLLGCVDLALFLGADVVEEALALALALLFGGEAQLGLDGAALRCGGGGIASFATVFLVLFGGQAVFTIAFLIGLFVLDHDWGTGQARRGTGIQRQSLKRV